MELEVQFWHLSCILIQCLYTTAYLLELQWCCTMSLSTTQAFWGIFFSPPPQTLKFQVKVPWNTLFFFLIQHLLWLLPGPDLEGSTYHACPVTSYNYTEHDTLSSAFFFPFQLTSSYLRVSKNIERVQLQIWLDDYWQARK